MSRKISRKGLMKKLDNLTREKVYERDNHTCVRCGRSAPQYVINPSHVIGRQNKRLRWDVNNVKTLCFTCHRWWHDNPTESGEWFKKKYSKRHKYLEKHKMEIQKTTVTALKELLEEL